MELVQSICEYEQERRLLMQKENISLDLLPQYIRDDSNKKVISFKTKLEHIAVAI